MLPLAALRVKDSEPKKCTNWNSLTAIRESSLEMIMRPKDLEMASSRLWRRKREGVHGERGREREKRCWEQGGE